MSKVVMPKNSAVLEEIEAVLKIYFEASDWLDNSEYKDKLKSLIGDDQYLSSYTKKSQITSYFGFTEWEDIDNSRSRRRITPQGIKMYRALLSKDKRAIQSILMESLERTVFGRNNFGVPASDTDIEPPALFIRAVLDLNYLSYNEFAYLLWKLVDDGGSYTDAVRVVKEHRKEDKNILVNQQADKYRDCKPIIMLVRWGFLANSSDGRGIIIDRDVLRDFKTRLLNLKIYNVDKEFKSSSITKTLSFKTNYKFDEEYSYNRIFFGAPGTGKSFGLEEEKDNLLNGNEGLFERVTFHPDYSYSQFVGTYKPVPKTDGDGITYKYVPGPFMRILVEALKNSESENPYLLIVEEINRANVASVFGDIFQLLDRKDGISEYAINLSEDMKGYIIDEFSKSGVEISPDNLTELKLPDNLFIWATMNSADQGVFLMDTAFKRRWEFERFGINDNEEKISNYMTGYELNWNALRRTINDALSGDSFKINEDKLMGPFFLKLESILEDRVGNILDSKKFNSIFKNKVLMYLFDDAVKQKRAQFFADGLTRYSQICEQFDKNFDEDGKLKNGTELKDVFSIFRNSESLFNDYQNFLSSTQNS